MSLPSYSDLDRLTASGVLNALVLMPGVQSMTVDYTGMMLVGTSASQVLTATTAKPYVFGMAGNDTINGSTADDILAGDYFDRSYLNALLNGQNPVPPAYQALVGNDSLSGAGGNDTFFDDLGNDTLNGGADDDYFAITVQSFGVDSFQGGAGVDELVVWDVWGLGFNFVTTSRLILNAAASIESFESDVALHGTAGADTIDFSGLTSLFFATSASVADVFLLAGNDRYIGSAQGLNGVDCGDGNDTASGGGSYDLLIGGNGNDSLSAGSGYDTLRGDAGLDTLDGGNDDDSLLGGLDQDRLLGGAGNDTLNGGAGLDTMIGGTGDDSYYVDGAADVVTEAAGSGRDLVYVTPGGAYVIAANVEDLTHTGAAAINATGNGLGNLMRDNAGNDTFSGLAGNDSLYSDLGNDLLLGGSGDDRLFGGAGNDTMNGEAGKDDMEGGLGNDVYYVDSANDTPGETANAGTDTVHVTLAKYALAANFEILVNDSTAGFAGTGNTGANTLIGNTGNDTLDGGLGADKLTGGAGGDTFLFSTAAGNGNVDTITDFVHGVDHIGLSHAASSPFHVLALGPLAASAFKVTGTGQSLDADDRIIYNQPTGKIYFDADGSGAGAGLVFAQVTAGLVLTASDFIVM